MERALLVTLGSVEQIPVGQGQCFVVNGEEIAVFRPRDGGIFAVQNQCPHRKGPLSEGVIGGGKVICPLHGHKFDLQTGKGQEEQECIRVYKIWEEAGQVRLEWRPGTAMATGCALVSS